MGSHGESTYTPLVTDVVRRCREEGCNRKAAVLVVDGVRKSAPVCYRHLPAVWKPKAERPNRRDSKAATTPSYCGARKKNGIACNRPAGWGTSHLGYGSCKLHGGSTRNNTLFSMKKEMSDRTPVMGLPLDIDPSEALLSCVRITAGEVMYATARVAELEAEAALVQDVVVTERHNAEYGSHRETKTSSTATIHLWIKTRQDAVDRLARYSKMAIDVGVEERLVRAAEHIGGLMGRVLQAVLDDLSLTPAQKALAPGVVHRHLTVLEAQVNE